MPSFVCAVRSCKRNALRAALGLFLCWPALAAAADTLHVRDFYARILANHPIVRQIRLLPQEARAEIRMARGLFDPVLGGLFDEKQFQGTNYYSRNEVELKIPTYWLEFSAGFQRNFGDRLSPEQSNPAAGTAYVGVSAPILRGLLIDERRNTLWQAKYFMQLNQAEQVKLLNKILLSAAKTYYEWLEAFQKYRFLQQGFDLAVFRYNAVKQGVLQGDEAPIDSVEAHLEFLKRQVALQEGKLEFQNTGLFLSNFLWDENGNPLQLDSTLYPSEQGMEVQNFTAEEIRTLAELATDQHPELLKLRYKLEQLTIERRYRYNNLLPYVNLEFKPLFLPVLNPLGVPTNSGGIQSNYAFGIGVYMPLFLRKERGKLLSTKLKLQETNFELKQSQREILNNVYQSYNELQTFEQLLRIQRLTVENAVRLQDGENQKFQNGESSLFIINRRERSTIEEQIKLIEIKVKYAKAKIALQWAAGRPLSELLVGNNTDR
jgi:outer membrane protein TolC